MGTVHSEWPRQREMSARQDFQSFFERERDGLFGALVLMTADRHEAEEIAQDAFLALWERWERIGRLEDPVGYLYRTAMNVFRKRRRRAAMVLRRSVRLVHTEDVFAAADARDVVARAMAGASRRQAGGAGADRSSRVQLGGGRPGAWDQAGDGARPCLAVQGRDEENSGAER